MGSCLTASAPGALGVLLFRNCGERGVRRWYESSDNRFEGNLFEAFDVALWIGSRQGLTLAPDRPPRDCLDLPGEGIDARAPIPDDACGGPFWWSDPSPSVRRFRDHAPGNLVTGNRFDRNRRAVIVWDDANVLHGNELRDSGVYDVCIGQAFREAIGEPLRDVVLEENLFVRTEASPDAVHVVDAHRASPRITGSRYSLVGSGGDLAWCSDPSDLPSSAACSRDGSMSSAWTP